MMQNNEKTRKIRGPVAIDEVGPRDQWETLWKERDLKRRDASTWASDPWENL